jgi:hypothetical protein
MRLEYARDARVKNGIKTLVKTLVKLRVKMPVKMHVKNSSRHKKAAKILAAHRTYYYRVGNCPTL